MTIEDRLHASLSLYMRAPAFVRRVVGGAYRLLPEHVRHGRLYPVHLAHAASQPRWSDIEQRLERTFAAAARAGAYAAHRTLLLDQRRPVWERLAELPPVAKPQIKGRLDEHLTDAAPHERLPMFTGGSTEHPMRFYLHRGVSRPKETAYIRHVESQVMGLRARSGAWTLSLRGRTVRSAGRAQGAMWTVEPIKRHLLFSSDHLEPRYMPSYLAALRRLRPPVIHAFPSALFPLARWLHAHPCPEFSDNVLAVLLTSESVYDFQMALFRRVFPNARLVRHYGHSERVLMAVAENDDCYRFFPLYGYPELLDSQGRVVTQPGVLGEIVGTGFDNGVMPFVRYRTGDMGLWREVPQPGLGEPRLEMQRIDGRLQEFVVCHDHRLVSITTLGAAHFAELAEVEAIQFEQRAPGRLTLRAAAASTLDEAARGRIATAVREKTQGGCEVDVEVVDRIERTERGKQRMLIQHLDLHRYLGAAVMQDTAPRTLEFA